MKVIAEINGGKDSPVYWVKLSSFSKSNDDLRYWTSTCRHKRSAVRAAKRFAEKHNFIITEWVEG